MHIKYGVVTVVLVTLSSLANVARCSLLFETCSSNDDCSVSNSHCQILSPSCGSGTCTCIPGFWEILNFTTYTCLRVARLGDSCKVGSDVCTTANAWCSPKGICECQAAYTPGPGGRFDVCTYGTQPVGGECSTSGDCFQFGNLVCGPGKKCQCTLGFRQYDPYRCVRRYYGEACNENIECWAMPNSRCLNGRCDCINGAVAKAAVLPIPIDNYGTLYDRVINGYACYADGEPSQEGQSCYSGSDYIVVSDFFPRQPRKSTQNYGVLEMEDRLLEEYPEGVVTYQEGNTANFVLPEKPVELLTLCAPRYQCTYCELRGSTCATIMQTYSMAPASMHQLGSTLFNIVPVLILLKNLLH